jgi:hypothetical protein
VSRRNGVHVIDPQDGVHLLCCWDTCERPGTTLHKVRIWEGVSPASGAPVYSWKIFCTDRHRMYYVNAPKDLNNLPRGHRLSII